ncbi:MAG: hypothetical protein GC204_16860 [Chloroflexi bacterium]|nr:hypothetical protein [Chloroflexota bacterium]
MGDENDTIRKLLYKIGVEANIRYDDEKRKVIIMSTAEYQLHQSWIDSWFTLVGQKGNYSFFHERQRGTGRTHHIAR